MAKIASEGRAAVKAYSMLDKPTYLALAGAADDAELPLVGHIPERVALGTAIAAGQGVIEHFVGVPIACATEEARLLADLRDRMAKRADRTAIFAVMAVRNRITLESRDEALCNRVLATLAKARTRRTY